MDRGVTMGHGYGKTNMTERKEPMMDIDTLEGMELAAAVAEARGDPFIAPRHGNCCTCQDCGHYHDECVCGVSYSMDDAGKLLTEMRRAGLAIYIAISPLNDEGSMQIVVRHGNETDGHDGPAAVVSSEIGVDLDETMAMCVCRAFLKAKAAT